MKHTKGKVNTAPNFKNPKEDSTEFFTSLNGKNYDIFRVIHNESSISEKRENIQLIAEAFNVTNECGLTPRQLLDAYYGLVAELKEFKGLVNETE